MRKLYNHSKSTLFLMEMILSILILSLTCTACVQIFAAARNNREKARQYNHIQELTVCAEEVLEGWDGRNETFTDLLPCSIQTEDTLQYFYDRNWELCEKADVCYTMTIRLETSNLEKSADLAFTDQKGNSLYQTSIAFPFQSENMSSSNSVSERNTSE